MITVTVLIGTLEKSSRQDREETVLVPHVARRLLPHVASRRQQVVAFRHLKEIRHREVKLEELGQLGEDQDFVQELMVWNYVTGLNTAVYLSSRDVAKSGGKCFCHEITQTKRSDYLLSAAWLAKIIKD